MVKGRYIIYSYQARSIKRERPPTPTRLILATNIFLKFTFRKLNFEGAPLLPSFIYLYFGGFVVVDFLAKEKSKGQIIIVNITMEPPPPPHRLGFNHGLSWFSDVCPLSKMMLIGWLCNTR